MVEETTVKLTEVEMIKNSVISLIEKYRSRASYTTHSMSRSWATYPAPCSDMEIMEFLQKLARKESTAELIISNIDWEDFGNCVGDELYPVYMDAVKLPDGRYFITISGYNCCYNKEEEEYEGVYRKEYILEL